MVGREKVVGSCFSAPPDFVYFPGDCLFDSLVYLLAKHGVVLSSVRLRQLAMETLDELQATDRSTQNTIRYTMQSRGITYGSYRAEMLRSCRDGGTRWGDHLCLTALAASFRCNIVTWDARTREKAVEFAATPAMLGPLRDRQLGVEGSRLHLKYYDGYHYEPLEHVEVEQQTESTGVVEVSDSSSAGGDVCNRSPKPRPENIGACKDEACMKAAAKSGTHKQCGTSPKGEKAAVAPPEQDRGAHLWEKWSGSQTEMCRCYLLAFEGSLAWKIRLLVHRLKRHVSPLDWEVVDNIRALAKAKWGMKLPSNSELQEVLSTRRGPNKPKLHNAEALRQLWQDQCNVAAVVKKAIDDVAGTLKASNAEVMKAIYSEVVYNEVCRGFDWTDRRVETTEFWLFHMPEDVPASLRLGVLLSELKGRDRTHAWDAKAALQAIKTRFGQCCVPSGYRPKEVVLDCSKQEAAGLDALKGEEKTQQDGRAFVLKWMALLLQHVAHPQGHLPQLKCQIGMAIEHAIHRWHIKLKHAVPAVPEDGEQVRSEGEQGGEECNIDEAEAGLGAVCGSEDSEGDEEAPHVELDGLVDDVANHGAPAGDSKIRQACDAYQKACGDVPTHMCGCCGTLCFKRQLQPYGSQVGDEIVEQIPRLAESGEVCGYCLSKMHAGIVPVQAGLQFPSPIPAIEDLRPLEAALVCPYLVFGNIQVHQYSGSDKLRKSIIYVPSHLNKVQSAMLPRAWHDANTIKVELKRQLHASAAVHKAETVRPKRMLDVLTNYISNPSACPVYAEDKFHINPEWLKSWQSANRPGASTPEDSDEEWVPVGEVGGSSLMYAAPAAGAKTDEGPTRQDETVHAERQRPGQGAEHVGSDVDMMDAREADDDCSMASLQDAASEQGTEPPNLVFCMHEDVPIGFCGREVNTFNSIFHVGNCLFEAVAYVQYYLTWGQGPSQACMREEARVLREAVFAVLLQAGPAQQEQIMEFVGTLANERGYHLHPDLPYIDYMSRLQADPYAMPVHTPAKALWGDFICLWGLQRVLGKQLLVYNKNVALQSFDRANYAEEGMEYAAAYHLLFVEEHYMPLVPCGGHELEAVPSTNTDSCNDSELQQVEEEGDLDEQEPPYNMDTFVDNTIRDGGRMLDEETVCLAPGEGNRPVGLWADPQAEEKIFLQVYYGQLMPSAIHDMDYRDRCKFEVCNVDRRVAHNSEQVFFMTKKLMIRQVCGAAAFRLRKTTMCNACNIRFGDVKTPEQRRELMAADMGFTDLANLRTSPENCMKTRKELFAMLRMVGDPTWFLTLSAADMHWPELLKAMYMLVYPNEPEPSKQRLDQVKVLLITKESCTAVRYFDSRWRAFLKLLQIDWSMYGPVYDWAFIIQFQNRGSPHLHGFLWVTGAPKWGNASDAEITAFVDKYVTCDRDKQPQLEYETQHHKHCGCLTADHTIRCRMGYPQYPMRGTMVLMPLDEEVIKRQGMSLGTLLKLHSNILNNLAGVGQGKDITWEQWLEQCQCTEEQYVLAIRATLKKPCIKLQRSCKDVRNVACSPQALARWQANHDAQFVLQPYAAAQYITSYMTRIDHAITKQLKQLLRQVREGQLHADEYTRITGNLFLNAQEITVAECIYHHLSLPMKYFSRMVTFLPTQRCPLVTLKKGLNPYTVSDASTDIWNKTPKEHYASRAPGTEDVCCLDWECKYTRTGRQRRRCGVPRVCNFSLLKDPEDFYRERVLCCVPWRDVEREFISMGTWEEHYKEHEASIQEIWRRYFPDRAKQEGDEVREDEGRHEDSAGQDKDPRDVEYDVALDMKNRYYAMPSAVALDFVTKTDNSRFCANMRLCNLQQRLIVDDVSFRKRVHPHEQVFLWLYGGAGVGKTFTHKLLNEAHHRRVLRDPGIDLTRPLSLIMGFTGTAAATAGGNTIHHTFPHNYQQQTEDMPNFSRSTLNTLRVRYAQVGLVGLTELSLIPNGLFQASSAWMSDILQVLRPFGGADAIADGDPYQLAPIGGSWWWIMPTKRNPLNTLAPNVWDKFRMYELINSERCKQKAWVDCMNRLRLGGEAVLDSDLDMLNSLLVSAERPLPRLCRAAFWHNKKIEEYNAEYSSRLHMQAYELVAIDEWSSDTPPARRKPSSKPQETAGLAGVVHIKFDEPVELSLNVNVSDSLTHGCMGIFKGVLYSDLAQHVPWYVWLHLDNPQAGVELRAAMRQLFVDNPQIPNTWTPIKQETKRVQPSKNMGHYYNRRQFPILPAAARSHVRNQSITLKQIALDFENITKHGMVYSGVSRAQEREGIYLMRKVQRHHLKVDERVTKFMEKMTAERRWQLQIGDIHGLCGKGFFTAITYNCQHFDAHDLDIMAASGPLAAAHVLHLTEAAPYSKFAAYDGHMHHVVAVVPAVLGNALLVRSGDAALRIVPNSQHACEIWHNEATLVSTCVAINNEDIICIAGVYVRPPGKVQVLSEVYTQVLSLANAAQEQHGAAHCLIMGDFNVNLGRTPALGVQPAALTEWRASMQAQGFSLSQSEPTHVLGSCLDHIWVQSAAPFMSGTLETYWLQDHYPVYIALKLPPSA